MGPMASHDDEESMTVAEHVENSTAGSEYQEQQEDRVQTDERMSMDDSDMEEAIDQEQDQKFEAVPESRYEDDVDEALSGDEG